MTFPEFNRAWRLGHCHGWANGFKAGMVAGGIIVLVGVAVGTLAWWGVAQP